MPERLELVDWRGGKFVMSWRLERWWIREVHGR